MAYKFPAEKYEKLESEERYESMQPVRRLTEAGMAEGEQVLDIGSGTGFYTRAAAEVVGKSGYVVGIDILEDMLVVARDLGAEENIEYRKSEESSFPVEDHTMDWALMTNLYHELEEPEQFIREIRRILKDRGSVYLTDWLPVEQEDGPPVEHRIHASQVIGSFETYGFTVTAESQIADSHYEIVLTKK